MSKKLTPEEKRANRRAAMLKVWAKKTLGGSLKVTAETFQKMTKAEAAARPGGETPVVIAGQLTHVYRATGRVACVTCGKVEPWNSQLMNCGHFVAGRAASIVLEPANVACQCVGCNKWKGGNQSAYRIWMEAVRGRKAIERLERLSTTVRKFTKVELAELRMDFMDRIKIAQEAMKTPPRTPAFPNPFV